MSKEKQIEEMAKVIHNTWLPINCGNVTVGERRIYEDDARKVANNIYDAGYRKQSEGEWKQVYNSFPRYVCTSCNHLFNNKSFKYCPNCGSKMKGGAE